MFNKVDVDFQEDSKAVTGDKTCQDPVTAETPATIEAAKDNVAAISSATATSLGGVANTWLELPQREWHPYRIKPPLLWMMLHLLFMNHKERT